jgi:LPXTG-motif cell wall-anchored protein
VQNKPKFIWFALFGGLLGAALTSWLAPKGIAWYFDPPVNIGVNCREATEWSMRKLQTAQAFGLVGGAVLGGIIWFLMRRRRDMHGDIPLQPRV